MSPRDSYQLPKIQPTDLQICYCWDDDSLAWVFGQWLDGPKHFVDAQVEWLDTITAWRPVRGCATI